MALSLLRLCSQLGCCTACGLGFAAVGFAGLGVGSDAGLAAAVLAFGAVSMDLS